LRGVSEGSEVGDGRFGGLMVDLSTKFWEFEVREAETSKKDTKLKKSLWNFESVKKTLSETLLYI
jgi:hypothetical protein